MKWNQLRNPYWWIYRLPISGRWKLELRRSYLYRYARKYDPEGHRVSFDFNELEEDERSYYSSQLRRRARRLRVEVPPILDEHGRISSDYVRSGIDGTVLYLSPAGERKLRASIREEERHRSEARTRIVPYITALSGLAGSLAGLAAVLKGWWP